MDRAEDSRPLVEAKGRRLIGVQVLWHGSYYDGPLNGYAMYQGRMVFWTLPGEWKPSWRPEDNGALRYEYFHDGVGHHKRVRYWVYPLTDGEIARSWRYHEIWCRLVGNHTMYENWSRIPREKVTMQPLEIQKTFYDQHESLREMLDVSAIKITQRDPLGYFRWRDDARKR